MKTTQQRAPIGRVDRNDTWRWPIDLAEYDQSPNLAAEELDALRALAPRLYGWDRCREPPWERVERLLHPLIEARDALDLATPPQVMHGGWAVTALLAQMLARGDSFWAWLPSTWIEVLGRDQTSFLAAHPKMPEPNSVRQPMIAIAYVLRCFVDPRPLGPFAHVPLARKVFGCERVDAAMARNKRCSLDGATCSISASTSSNPCAPSRSSAGTCRRPDIAARKDELPGLSAHLFPGLRRVGGGYRADLIRGARCPRPVPFEH